MSHYVILADQGHLRIFSQQQDPEQMRASLREVEALDFPLGVKSYTETDTDMAGLCYGLQATQDWAFEKIGSGIASTGARWLKWDSNPLGICDNPAGL